MYGLLLIEFLIEIKAKLKFDFNFILIKLNNFFVGTLKLTRILLLHGVTSKNETHLLFF
jgi:hypothetical protein